VSTSEANNQKNRITAFKLSSVSTSEANNQKNRITAFKLSSAAPPVAQRASAAP